MPMYHWNVTEKDSAYDGWHVIVSAPNVEKARIIAFDSFSNDYGVQAAFHLDYEPEKVVEGDGAIIFGWST